MVRRTELPALTKSISSVSVQQVALEILHKAIPLPSLGNQWVIAHCSVSWTWCVAPHPRPPLSAASCFPNDYMQLNKQALSLWGVGQTHIAPLPQLFKWLLEIAVFANKVWLSELEHQRAGWFWQQHTACTSEWAGCQLHPSRSCNQHQSCVPAGQIGEQWSAAHSSLWSC